MQKELEDVFVEIICLYGIGCVSPIEMDLTFVSVEKVYMGGP